MSFWGYWEPRKTAAQRRAESARKVHDAARRGKPLAPVTLAGRKIAETFWGKAWCDNLERYQDFAYRLDRGRSYLRSGSVIDLQIRAGKVIAQVCGSSDYDVEIEIDAVTRPAWREIQRACAGGIASRLDLLAGRLSDAVMTRLCADGTGMFPAPAAIRFTCSCPDYASMCKHVAAAMYGVGARLDQAPELLFTLRKVSADELIASALSELPAAPSPGRVLATGGLSALFGIELADAPAASAKPTASKPTASKPTTSKPTASKPTASKPTASKSTASKPAASKPTASKPAASKLTASKPAASKSTASKSAASKPTKPAAAKPAQPAAAKPAHAIAKATGKHSAKLARKPTAKRPGSSAPRAPAS